MLQDPDRSLFACRLSPHRSMTRPQARVLLCFMGLAGIGTSVPFVIMGAWPVAGFFGIDVLLVYLAFSASFRAARAYETVNVTMVDLQVEKVSARGARSAWRCNPRWARIERRDHEEFGTQHVNLVAGGGRVEVGSFLGPDAKAVLADGLTRALNEVRRGILLPDT